MSQIPEGTALGQRENSKANMPDFIWNEEKNQTTDESPFYRQDSETKWKNKYELEIGIMDEEMSVGVSYYCTKVPCIPLPVASG